jgi:hypothetical protein
MQTIELGYYFNNNHIIKVGSEFNLKSLPGIFDYDLYCKNEMGIRPQHYSTNLTILVLR